ncbi:hypothetical protein P692DRAFT_201862083 [Suillus brevipes Sb2]|nr:hypothetical protein P692DRAFT_201862083 [Suillus brevipes Sb2]
MCDTCSCNTLRQSQTLDHHDVPQNTRTSDSTPTKSQNPIPSDWEPPSSPISCFFFRVMCICLTLHWDLEFMWEIFREPNGWENFHDLYLKQINQCSTVQGLVLTTVAVFISTLPPLKQIDYAASGPYTLLSESLVFSLFGLLFQLYTSVVGHSYQKQKTFEALKRSRWLFLCHIIILSIPVYTFGISLLLLIFAISVTGFLSSSKSAQIFTGATFALLAAYLVASIIPSPVYPRLHNFLYYGTRKTKNDFGNRNGSGQDHGKEAGSVA